MIKAELDKELFLACTDYDHDLDKIKKLIQAGADTNQTNKYGGSIFDFVCPAESLIGDYSDFSSAVFFALNRRKSKVIDNNSFDFITLGEFFDNRCCNAFCAGKFTADAGIDIEKFWHNYIFFQSNLLFKGLNGQRSFIH